MSAEFCNPECGLRANCSGRITEESVAQVSVAKKTGMLKRLMGKDPRNFDNWGTYTVVSDAEGHTSEVIPTGRKTPEEVVRAIGACAGPGKSLCGAFPDVHYSYEDTAAARLVGTQEMQEQLAITEGNR